MSNEIPRDKQIESLVTVARELAEANQRLLGENAALRTKLQSTQIDSALMRSIERAIERHARKHGDLNAQYWREWFIKACDCHPECAGTKARTRAKEETK